MTHFSQPEWTDFARGIQSPATEAMKGHLAGCSRCRKTVAIWEGVREVTVKPDDRRVPGTALRTVKGVFTLHKPRKAPRLARFATLLFDSFLQPSQLDVRSAAEVAGGTRQLLYRGGSYVVDLRMEPHNGAGFVVMVGQVMNLSRDSLGAPAVRVVLERGRTALAAAVANEFGEFVLEYEEKGELRLRVETLGQKPLLIPLGQVEPAEGVAARGY